MTEYVEYLHNLSLAVPKRRQVQESRKTVPLKLSHTVILHKSK